MIDFRCTCGKLLAKIEPGSRVEIRCPRCKTLIVSSEYIEFWNQPVHRDMVRDDIYLSEAQRIRADPMDASKVTVMTEEEYLKQFKNL